MRELQSSHHHQVQEVEQRVLAACNDKEHAYDPHMCMQSIHGISETLTYVTVGCEVLPLMQGCTLYMYMRTDTLLTCFEEAFQTALYAKRQSSIVISALQPRSNYITSLCEP